MTTLSGAQAENVDAIGSVAAADQSASYTHPAGFHCMVTKPGSKELSFFYVPNLRGSVSRCRDGTATVWHWRNRGDLVVMNEGVRSPADVDVPVEQIELKRHGTMSA
jgi:hypothetical protein